MLNILNIPINNQGKNPYFKQIVELDGIQYEFLFKYNRRSESWYLDISDQKQNLIFGGIKLIANYDLTKKYGIPNLFKGSLILFDSMMECQEADFNSLGIRHLLLYIKEEE